MIYRITRDRHQVTSQCEDCLDWYSTYADSAVERWQREHHDWHQVQRTRSGVQEAACESMRGESVSVHTRGEKVAQIDAQEVE